MEENFVKMTKKWRISTGTWNLLRNIPELKCPIFEIKNLMNRSRSDSTPTVGSSARTEPGALPIDPVFCLALLGGSGWIPLLPLFLWPTMPFHW